jgi:hypothetical protein
MCSDFRNATVTGSTAILLVAVALCASSCDVASPSCKGELIRTSVELIYRIDTEIVHRLAAFVGPTFDDVDEVVKLVQSYPSCSNKEYVRQTFTAREQWKVIFDAAKGQDLISAFVEIDKCGRIIDSGAVVGRKP